MRLQGSHKAPTKRQQSLETDHGLRTTDNLRGNEEGRRKNDKWPDRASQYRRKQTFIILHSSFCLPSYGWIGISIGMGCFARNRRAASPTSRRYQSLGIPS